MSARAPAIISTVDTARHNSLANRGLVVSDSSGNEAVRVYLQYLPDLPGRSRDARREALRNEFQRIAEKGSRTGVELDPGSLSVSGQVIEALVPIQHFDEAKHVLENDGVRVDLVEPFDATL